MRKIILSCVLTITFIALSMPFFSFAQQTGNGASGPILVKCSGPAIAGGGGNECNWPDLIEQTKKVINFLFVISVILATIAFIYCGFLFLTSGGDTAKAGDAKKVFFKVVVGFIWIFAAWLIVHLITTSLGLKDDISIMGQP